MRINVSAEAGFFHYPNYGNFEKLLAAAAAGCMSVHAKDNDAPIDVQINTVITAQTAAQYVFYHNTFYEANAGRSLVTMEIDHINKQSSGDNEQLMCLTAIVLVKAIYGVWQNQNCWSKMHGGETNETGWAEGTFSDEAVKETFSAVTAFSKNAISAQEMVIRLSSVLMPS